MRGGVWTTAQKPLLPGYVFAFATEADEPALSVHPDVLRILQYADKHRALVGGDLAFARWIQDHGGTIGISKAYFDEGQRIVIASGPLSDYHGKILRIDKRKQRALVELDFAGRQQTVSLSFDYLKENNEAG
jgi:transcription antitermination factor NusG